MTDSAEIVRRRIAESIAVQQALREEEPVRFALAFADLVTSAYRAGGKVILCGNGGSAADATHLAAELVGRFSMDRAPLPALSLTDNASSTTAIANDYAYEEAFARQVRGLGRAGDILVGLSTSGESANVLAALAAGRQIGMRTVGLTGAGGGRLADRVDLCLRVPSRNTARIQEGCMVIGHTVCELVEHALFA